MSRRRKALKWWQGIQSLCQTLPWRAERSESPSTRFRDRQRRFCLSGALRAASHPCYRLSYQRFHLIIAFNAHELYPWHSFQSTVSFRQVKWDVLNSWTYVGISSGALWAWRNCFPPFQLASCLETKRDLFWQRYRTCRCLLCHPVGWSEKPTLVSPSQFWELCWPRFWSKIQARQELRL